MPFPVHRNFFSGTITDNPLTDVATTINSSAFADLPLIDLAGDGTFMWITLDPDADDGAPEIVKVVTHGTSSTEITVTREEQNTTAREHVSGTAWHHAWTQEDAELWSSLLNEELKIPTSALADDAVTTAKIDDGAVTPAKLEATAWTSHTPTLAQGTATDIAKTVDYSEYIQLGKTVIWNFRISATAAGDDLNAITLTLPVTAADADGVQGQGSYWDPGTTSRTDGALVGASTTTVAIASNSSSETNRVGVTPNIAVASGGVFQGSVIYEAA
jgi:hypothetical protein